MNKYIGLKLYKHINKISLLSQQEIMEILEVHPEFEYNGEGFRGLSFSRLNTHSDISNDTCFSKNEKAIKNMSYLFDHKYIQVYKAHIIGLDLEKCMHSNLFADFIGGDLRDIISSEKEVIATQVYSIELIYNGLLSNYLEN